MRHDDDDPTKSNHEYEVAYEVIRYAMTLVDKHDLGSLKNALHKASFFVNDELDELPELVEELGLGDWLEAEQADDEAVDE